MIVVTILLIFLPYQGDNGSSSSKYSFKIDKVKWGGKGACFPNMEKASVQVCQTQTDWFNKKYKTKTKQVTLLIITLMKRAIIKKKKKSSS